AAGDLVLLPDQNRSLWNRAQIEDALPLVEAALRSGRPGRPGPFALQAAIAALHAEAASAERTDWPQIHALYRLLEVRQPSPVVTLNRVIAGALAATVPGAPGTQRTPESAPPEGGDTRAALESALGEIDALEASGGLDHYRLLPAARADLLRRLGRPEQAEAAYRRARDLAANSAERRYLERRIGEMTAALRAREIPD